MLNQCTYIGNQPLSPSTHYVPDAPAAYISHALQEGSATDFVLEGTRKHIQYKWIQQFDQFWARLREDPDVKRIGIMICEDVGISMDAAKIRERKAQGGILPLSKSNMGESGVFAVELKIVTTGCFHRKLLRLKDKGPNVGDNRLAGMDSDEDSDEEAPVDEDFILADVDTDTVNDMIQD
ncbi:unnamed protein product [Alternaria alternata]